MMPEEPVFHCAPTTAKATLLPWLPQNREGPWIQCSKLRHCREFAIHDKATHWHLRAVATTVAIVSIVRDGLSDCDFSAAGFARRCATATGRHVVGFDGKDRSP